MLIFEQMCDTLNASGAFDPLRNPAFCSNTWCYVDPAQCNVNSTFTAYLAGVSDLAFSYEACMNQNLFTSFYLAMLFSVLLRLCWFFSAVILHGSYAR